MTQPVASGDIQVIDLGGGDSSLELVQIAEGQPLTYELDPPTEDPS